MPPRLSARRLPELDGIRGLAILSVIYWHYLACPNALAGPRTLGGILHRIGLLTWSGVDLFFVLSGFLIGGSCSTPATSRSIFRISTFGGFFEFCRSTCWCAAQALCS